MPTANIDIKEEEEKTAIRILVTDVNPALTTLRSERDNIQNRLETANGQTEQQSIASNDTFNNAATAITNMDSTTFSLLSQTQQIEELRNTLEIIAKTVKAHAHVMRRLNLMFGRITLAIGTQKKLLARIVRFGDIKEQEED